MHKNACVQCNNIDTYGKMIVLAFFNEIENWEECFSVQCTDIFDEHYRDACGDGQWVQMWYFDHRSGTCLPFWCV